MNIGERLRGKVRERGRRLRAVAVVVAQTSVATALAWVIADGLLRNPQPVFAPISAVITLGVSTGQRFRRAVELVVGVALGVAVGDALIFVIGTGGWQIGLAVALAMAVTVVAGGTPAMVVQAATSAVLVATLVPPQAGIYFTRVLDALVGGVVALAVMAVLLPVNPLTLVSRVARPALGVLIEGLAATARGLEQKDQVQAHEALIALSEGEAKLDEFRKVLPEGREAATLAPLRWHARNALRQYVEAAEYIERSVRNARVLARRTVTLLSDNEPAPQELAASVAALSEAATVVRRDLRSGSVPQDAADLIRQAVRQANAAYEQGLGFSGNVVVAQIRAIATDLLGTTGLPHEDANREVRRVGDPPHRQ